MLVSESIAHPYRRFFSLAAEEIPYQIGYQQKQQKKVFTIGKFHFDILLYMSHQKCISFECSIDNQSYGGGNGHRDRQLEQSVWG